MRKISAPIVIVAVVSLFFPPNVFVGGAAGQGSGVRENRFWKK